MAPIERTILADAQEIEMNEMMDCGGMMLGMGVIGVLGIVALVLLIAALGQIPLLFAS